MNEYMYTHIHIYIWFISKEVAHTIVGAGKCESCQAGQQIENSDRSYFHNLKAEFLFLWETSNFALKALNWLDKACSYC